MHAHLCDCSVHDLNLCGGFIKVMSLQLLICDKFRRLSAGEELQLVCSYRLLLSLCVWCLLHFVMLFYVQCKDFIQSNVFLAVGFGGGFLIGLAI